MQLNHLLRFFACAAGALALAGCKDGNAARGSGETQGTAAATAPAGAAGAAGTYVLVTQLRPEAPEKFFAHERGAYALCAEVASHQQIPVKPFPVIPPDFVSKRSTYASDGKRTAFREVLWHIDTRKAKAEQGCEMRLASTWSASVVSNGEERSADQDENGQVHVAEAQPVPSEEVRASRLAMYTAPKTVKGVPVKCSSTDDCIVDPAQALVKQGMRPVQAAARIDDVRTYGTALVLEPVSLAVGKPVDPALFSLDKNQ